MRTTRESIDLALYVHLSALCLIAIKKTQTGDENPGSLLIIKSKKSNFWYRVVLSIPLSITKQGRILGGSSSLVAI